MTSYCPEASAGREYGVERVLPVGYTPGMTAPDRSADWICVHPRTKAHRDIVTASQQVGPAVPGGSTMRVWLTMGLAAALMTSAAAQAPMAELKVGDMAPDFSLQASDGKTYKLADYRGKRAVVVAWFPKAFTGGCTIECKSLADNGATIKMYDVAYFMASVDTVEDNTKFAKATSVTLQGRGGGPSTVVEKKEADFPMLADPTKEVAAKYGVLMPNPPGFANRWTFYIDKEGKISYIEKKVQPATSAEDMIAKLGELKVPMTRH